MAATDAKLIPIKGQAYRLTAVLLDADGDPDNSGTLTSVVSKDGGAGGAGPTPVAIASTSGGVYVDLTTTNMDADSVYVEIASNTAGVKKTALTLYPVTDVRQLGVAYSPMYKTINIGVTSVPVPFYVTDLTGRPATGLTIALSELKVASDLGTPASAQGTIAEVSAANHPGLYKYSPHSTEVASAVQLTGALVKTGYLSGGFVADVVAAVTVTGGRVVAVADAVSAGAITRSSFASDLTIGDGIAVPGDSDSIPAVLEWVGTLSRNKITQTATTQTLRNNADNGNLATSTVSDDGTTSTVGKWT